jgi:hypothetical protein
MVASFLRKLASQVKSKRKHEQLWAVWARPGLESLDQRILPSVTTTLDPMTGILSVLADQTGGTTQVEIVQTPNNTQITIGDTGTQVNSFNLSDVQQIQFQYASFPALNIPVNGSQMTLTGFNITEADLNLGDNTLSAAVNATLPDGTALSVAGSIDNQGNYDLTGSADITVDGFPLPSASFELTNTSLAAAATLAIGSDSVSLAGSLDNQGNYDLTGTADITVATIALHANFELTNTSLAAAASLAIGSDSVSLAGSVDNQGQYDLTGAAMVSVAGFSIDASFELTNTSLTASGMISVGGTNVSLQGTVDSQGHYDLMGTADIMVAGFNLPSASFELTNTSLAASASLAIGNDSVSLAGNIDNQFNYDLTGAAMVSLAGFSIDASFELTNTQLNASGMVNIPNIGNLTFSGTVDNQGSYNLTASTQLTVSGVTINASLTLTNTQLAIAATVNLPLVGSIDLSGTVDSQGQFSMSANVSNVTILFVTLTNASVTLTNDSLTLDAQATGIPLLDTVNFTGMIGGGSWTFTATLPSVSIAGFTLTNVMATLDNTSFRVAAHATGIPLVDTLDFSGTISASGFSLSATATNVDVLGFIHFASISLTLSNNPLGLSLSAATTLPVVGDVTFTGTIDPSGNFTISATAPSFTVLGFLTFNDATVSLRIGTNSSLTVSAGIDLLNIGHVMFSGTITAGGHYSFTASASLTVAGFMLGTGNLSFSDAPANCINIGPFTTVPLPLVGAVTIQGMYCSGGVFSFLVTLHPTPPIMIGPIPVDTIIFGLSNDSLTLGIGIGYDLSSFLHIGGTGVVTVYSQSAQHNLGDFELRTTVDVTLVGFQAAGVTMDLKNDRGQFSFTIDGNINLLIATVNVHGEIDFNRGLVGFAGSANIAVAGFTLSSSNFLITNAQVQFVSGMWTFPHDSMGHLIPGSGIHIEVHSHTALHLPPIVDASIDFDGSFQKVGTSGYQIAVHGVANLTVVGFNLANASLDIDNTHMAVHVHFVYGAVFTVDFAGSLTSTGVFDVSGSAALGLAGFVSVASASFHLTNTMLSISAMMNLKVATVSLNGTFQSNGNFSLTGSASVSFAGFNAVTGSFTLNNSGARVSATVNVFVAQVAFSGSIQSNGTFSLTGSASVGLAGFPLATASFTMNNGGASFSASINVFVATVSFSGSVDTHGNFRLTGSANVGLAGFPLATASFVISNGGVTFSATINVRVATVNFSGSVDRFGNFQVTGSATVGFAGFGGSGSFTLRNSGLTVSASVNVRVAQISVTGSVSSSGAFSFTVNTSMSFAGFSASGSLTLNNNGVTVSATLGIRPFNVGISFSGSVFSNGNFSFSVHAGFNWFGIGASVDFTLNQGGFSAHLHAGFDLTAGISFGPWSLRVGFRGSVDVNFGIQTNGNFSASGNIQACAYLGIGICVGIGFRVNTHQFCFLTSGIGFSLWGVGFHPFGDLCVNF